MSEPTPAQPSAVQSFAGLGPLDAGKLDDVVSAVWDHRDDVAGAVTFFREHGDELVALAARLPDLLGQAAAALTEAAADTRGTAQFLTGAGDSGGDSGGVRALAQTAGDALDACQRELGEVRRMLAGVADVLDGVPMVGKAADRLTAGVAHFDAVGTQLAAVADSLRGIGGLVDQAGAGLARTADRLEDGGRALSRFGA